MPLSKKFRHNTGNILKWGSGVGAVQSLTGKEKNIQQNPLETPEQKAAREKLMGFADTGAIGGFTAGADLGLGQYDANMTGTEQAGQTAIQGLLNLDPSYTDPLRAAMARSTGEANDALKRNAAFAGNLYSTKTIEGLGDVQARGNESMMAQLASLRLRGIDYSQQYGGLARDLNNAKIAAREQEILRRREELKMPLQTYSTIMGTPVNFGVQSIPYRQPSPYMDLLNLGAKVYGATRGSN